jgi:hypothetical protein
MEKILRLPQFKEEIEELSVFTDLYYRRDAGWRWNSVTFLVEKLIPNVCTSLEQSTHIHDKKMN